MRNLTIFKDSEIMLIMSIIPVSSDAFLSCYPTSSKPKETIPNFIEYLSRVTNCLYGFATATELKIEKMRNQEKVTFFSNLEDMTEFYDELTQTQHKLYDLHQEIGKIDTIMNFVFTQKEENEKEAEWSIDWE